MIDEIAAQGVPCYAGSAAEIYLEEAFRDAGLGPAERLPVAQELGETSLCFLCHPTLTDEHVERTIEVVAGVMGRAVRQPTCSSAALGVPALSRCSTLAVCASRLSLSTFVSTPQFTRASATCFPVPTRRPRRRRHCRNCGGRFVYRVGR